MLSLSPNNLVDGNLLVFPFQDYLSDPARLELQQTGRALYAPLFIDLNSTRRTKALTWRQLTVGEELRIVGSDEAVAFRVQIGQDQWLIYRSLAPATRRTALGMHTAADFYIGRFDADEGEVDTIVEVEACS